MRTYFLPKNNFNPEASHGPGSEKKSETYHLDAQPSAIGPWPENIAGENSDFSEVPRGDVNGIIISAKIMNWIILIKIRKPLIIF